KPNYIRIPYYYIAFNKKITFNENMSSKLNGKCQPQEKEVFACFLVSNGSKGINEYIGNGLNVDGTVARDELFHKLGLYKNVESGSRHLNNIGRVLPADETKSWLCRCKFVIAYETQSVDGYISDLVFQAYFAGAIPLYYGHSNAVTDINEKAVIY